MSTAQVNATLVAIALCYLILLALCCYVLTRQSRSRRESSDE